MIDIFSVTFLLGIIFGLFAGFTIKSYFSSKIIIVPHETICANYWKSIKYTTCLNKSLLFFSLNSYLLQFCRHNRLSAEFRVSLRDKALP